MTEAVPHVHAVEQNLGLLVNIAAGTASDQGGQDDVFDRGEGGQQVEGLEDDAEATAAEQRPAAVAHGGQILPLDDHLAPIGLIECPNQVQERAFTRPAGSHDRHELAGCHREGHIPHGVNRFAVRGKDLLEAGYLKDSRHAIILRRRRAAGERSDVRHCGIPRHGGQILSRATTIMPEVHATAIVSRETELDTGVVVGPHVVIEGRVRIARGVRIISQAYIGGEMDIGEDTVIHPFVAIGGLPQDYRHKGEPSACRIGARNQIREGVTIHRGTVEDSATVIGDDNMLMANVHVGHNVQIGNHAVITNAVLLAGYASVGDHAVLGGGAGIHQFVRVGHFTMVSGLSRITRDLLPFMTYAERDECIGVNRIGLRRNGYGPEVVTELRSVYRALRGAGDTRETATRLSNEVQSEAARQLLTFLLAESKRGIALRGRRSRVEGADV